MPEDKDPKRGGRRGKRGGDIKATGLRREDRAWVEQNQELLSPTTLRAKWVSEPGEGPDRPGQTLATRSPEVIRDWAQRREAEPVTTGRADEDGRPRTLRMAFREGKDNSRLRPVAWEDWFRTFQERELVFLYQETRRDGSDSNFFRLDSPQREEG
jgi:hypothetical protein